MRALVTGGAGFVGQWLSAALLDAGWDVHGAALARPDTGVTLRRDQLRSIEWHVGDLRDAAFVAHVVGAAKCDVIFHLAGVAFLPDAGDDPRTAWGHNVDAGAHLIAAAAERRRGRGSDPLVLVVGSGEEYGAHAADELPLVESAELRPASVYAETKVAQERAALEAGAASGLRVIATRSFNHSGRGQSRDFLLPALADRVAGARRAQARTVPLGNPAPIRDFLHVRDVVLGYISLAQRGVPGRVYNICSGVGRSVREVASLMLARAGVEADLVTDPSLLRPVDVPVLVGSHALLTRDTGWSPHVSFESLVDELLDAASH